MAEVPRETDCRVCGARARRSVTAPHLSRSGTSAFQLMERSAKSASEPEIVSGVPPSASRRAQSTTRHPLHAKLPRP
ncbi:FmdB family zinc ribbon protein [Leucobacter muris]|nr:zinc ribbon domain-containing protein [Leucobacter muris]